jgi:hypothetical protein
VFFFIGLFLQSSRVSSLRNGSRLLACFYQAQRKLQH